MPVDYAEPTKLQNFKVEVFQPGSDTPTLTKPANSTTDQTAPGQLTVPNRDTGLGKPNNLPERQNSLRNDGQYRTVDVTPTNTAKPAPKKQNNQLTTGNAGDAATYEAAYYAGLFIGGVISGALNNTPQSDSIKDAITPEELATTEGGYETGQELRRSVKEAVENGEKLLDNLWRNKPTFEIPQIKIPKFDLPELPNLEPPKFPEFKFPEISLPKPQPIPVPKPKRFKPNPPPFDPKAYEHCGRMTLRLAFGFSLIGIYFDGEITNSYIYTNIPVGVDTCYNAYKKCNPNAQSKEILLDGVNNTGFVSDLAINNTVVKIGYSDPIAVNHDCSRLNPPFGSFSFPVYFITQRTVTVPANAPTGTIAEILSYFTTSEAYPEVIKVVADSNAASCQFPRPLVDTPPPPPPEDDCCRMGCCPKPTEIDYRLIKKIVDQTLKEQKFAIQVPIYKCEFNNKTNKWTPKTDTVIMEVFATSQLQADQLAQLHLENARQAADLCLARNTEEPVAAIPQSWQIRHEGGKPQLVIHCAEKKEDGKYGSAMYPITVPHWKGGIHDKPPLPAYKKGNWEGILVLADTSKVTINAVNESECTKILNAIKPWINKEMLKDSYFKGGKINIEIKPTQVKPMYGRYFSTGQKNNKPDWIAKDTDSGLMFGANSPRPAVVRIGYTAADGSIEQGVGGRVWGVGFGWMGILTPTNLYTP
jgi:hypothetical protein